MSLKQVWAPLFYRGGEKLMLRNVMAIDFQKVLVVNKKDKHYT